MIKAQLFAMGTQRELLSTQLTYHRTANAKTGRSGPIPMGGLVTLTFTSGDGDDRLLRWITHSPEGELCTLTAVKIVFYKGDPDGSTLFEYQLHDAALVHWKEEFKATGTAPMTVTITISAAIQTIKGITWIKPWRESRALSEETAAHKEGVQRGVSHNRRKKEDGSPLEGVVLEGARGSFNYDYREVEIIDASGKPIGEFDRIDFSKKTFIEDKSGSGLDSVNPRTGLPAQTPIQWAEKQIFNKTVVRIDNLKSGAVSTRATKGGSQTIPSLNDIKDFKSLHFKIEGNSPELISGVRQQLTNLKNKYPDWTFTAEFGK